MKTPDNNAERIPLPPESRFSAPWGGLLIGVSLSVTAVILFVAMTIMRQPASPGFGRALVALSPLVLLLACALFTIRGYVLAGDELWVRRLFWSTPIKLQGLRAARIDREAVRWSLRTFGNGGLFSISGWFWNRRLGRYRMFATYFRQPVVLDWGDRRLVVTPGDAESFVQQLNARCAAH